MEKRTKTHEALIENAAVMDKILNGNNPSKMKNYVKEYKGFTVPRGAKYFAEDSINQRAGFYKWDSNEVMFFSPSNGKGWVKSINSNIPRAAIELPEALQEWMPVVGKYCEVESGEGGDWRKSMYVGVDSCGAHVFDVEEKFLWRIRSISEFVRPLKTKEETDREAFIARCVSLTKLNGSMSTEGFGIAYDNGARFAAPKAVDNE